MDYLAADYFTGKPILRSLGALHRLALVEISRVFPDRLGTCCEQTFVKIIDWRGILELPAFSELEGKTVPSNWRHPNRHVLSVERGVHFLFCHRARILGIIQLDASYGLLKV